MEWYLIKHRNNFALLHLLTILPWPLNTGGGCRTPKVGERCQCEG